MKVSEDRYDRDRRNLDLAIQMIRYEVRTSIIQEWTGLRPCRIRTLVQRVLNAGTAGPVIRHRGPRPTDVTRLLRFAPLRAEVSAAIGVCQTLNVIPPERGPRALRSFVCLPRGEKLCLAYQAYRAQAPQARLKLEQMMLVVRALVSGEQLSLGHCGNCEGVIIVDSCDPLPLVCPQCYRTGLRSADGVRDEGPVDDYDVAIPPPDSLPFQHSLF